MSALLSLTMTDIGSMHWMNLTSMGGPRKEEKKKIQKGFLMIQSMGMENKHGSIQDC